ncbi:MAG: lytic murein transglycosylase [Desulfobacterales bacterium]
MYRKRFFFFAALVGLWLGPAAGQEGASGAFEALKKRLVADGFAPEAVERLYARPEVFVEADGVARFFVHSEAKLDYDQFTTPESIARAKAYLSAHAGLLGRVEAAFGVEREVITAILLVESRLGTVTGGRSALNILSTLGALTDPAFQEDFYRILPAERRISRERYLERVQKRAEWGYRELKALLRYAEREGLDPAAIPASYAGAVGFAQFMPTNILAYGEDGDGDGRVDLFAHADAVASIANYLRRHGWRPGIDRESREKAIHAYNPSVYYVNAILAVAERLRN